MAQIEYGKFSVEHGTGGMWNVIHVQSSLIAWQTLRRMSAYRMARQLTAAHLPLPTDGQLTCSQATLVAQAIANSL